MRFRLLAEVPPIEMRLDLLELHSNGDLVIEDFKTSKSRWPDSKVQESLPQMLIYALGLLPVLRDVGAKRVVPRFTIITKAKTPVVQILEPQATQSDVDRLKHDVAETWNAIQANIFVPRQSWQCAQCPFRKRCLG